MKCMKCGKETNDHVYTCLEITTMNNYRFAEEKVTGAGKYAICDECVQIPLPKLVGELFKKRVTDAKRSIIHWSPILTQRTENDSVIKNLLLPLDRDLLQTISEEKKTDRRFQAFLKYVLFSLDTSLNFKSMIIEKIFETGKWKAIVDGSLTDPKLLYHVDILH